MPTDNDVMTYDKTYHKYLLNPAYLKKQYGWDFIEREGSETKAKNMMLKISRRIYNYIYNHHLQNKKYWEWHLAFDSEVRHYLENALIAQAEFEWESNISSLQHQIGINLLNGTKISQNDLKGNRGIALEAENELRFYRDGILLYTGKVMYLTEAANLDYDELGY